MRGKDGRLSAYVPAEGGLLRWTETRAGGPDWDRPVLVAVPHLTHLSVTQDANGYVHFVGRREQGKADGRRVVDVVYAIQYQSGRAVSQWRSLGNPHKDAESAARLGRPVAVVTAAGMVHIFVRNADGGLTLRREQSDGKWRGWEDRNDSGIEGSLAAIALSSGRIELFATTDGGTLHWSQKQAGGALGAGYPSGFAVVRDSVAVLETGPDRPTYYWTDPRGTAWWPTARVGGPWPWAGRRVRAPTRRPARSSTVTTAPCWLTREWTARPWSAWASPRTRETACGGRTPVCGA